eukprot:scaffold4766_cov115-Isochrysis_galbana.AAC.3
MSGGGLGLFVGILVRRRRSGCGCGPMAQIAAVLLRETSRGSGVHFEGEIRSFADRPADVT